MTIKHLLCDLDETLLHTLSTTKNAYDCVFDSLNMPRKTAAEIKKATGGKPKSEIFGYMLCGETFAAGGKHVKNHLLGCAGFHPRGTGNGFFANDRIDKDIGKSL
mgnify:CR=1 FL=1